MDSLVRFGLDDRWKWFYMAAAYGQLEKLDEARSLAERCIFLIEEEYRSRGEPMPDDKLALADEEASYFRCPADAEHLLDGLRKAGFSG